MALNNIPDGDVKLIEFCSGYTGEDPRKVVIEFLWRIEEGDYFINDSEGFVVEASTRNLIQWIDEVIDTGEQYYCCYHDVNIHDLRGELMELIND